MKSISMISQPEETWLDCLSSIYPPTGVMVVGAGNGSSIWVQWLYKKCVNHVILVEGNQKQFQLLKHNIPLNKEWVFLNKIVIFGSEPHIFHYVDNSRESGLLSPEQLHSLWPNIKCIDEEVIHNGITLNSLQKSENLPLNWLFIDCLPAPEILEHAGDMLHRIEVVVSRVVIQDDPFSASLKNLDKVLNEVGMRRVHLFQERHPSIGYAIYTRNLALKIIEAESLKAEIKQQQRKINILQSSLEQQSAEYKLKINNIEKNHKLELDKILDKKNHIENELLELKNKSELSVINLNEFHAVNENILSKYEMHTDNVCAMMQKIEKQQKEIYIQINKNLPVLIKKELDAKLNKSVRHVESFISIQQYLTHGDCITGFHGWPISPDMGVFLLEKIRERNYDAIIEFGSGVSTLLIAKGLMAFNLFKDNEDKCFISFDHDEYYFANTQNMLAYHGVESMVDLHLAPLKEWSDSTGRYKYYSCEDVLIELAKRLRDGPKRLLVLVDGPPGNTCANARYPALPFMSHFISNHEIDWVLDDAYRDEEKLTAELWAKYWSAENIQFTHDFIKNEKGMFFATTYGKNFIS
ncbi:hypothetical protein V8U24_17000 [Escherichia marmotae]|uniref:hypothetical protein n=1 Tax=Escherichia TaxID=561 RepID=UPI000CF75669|nr:MULTISPECIES: hypothetical protein [Escherichia]MBB2403539.1 hypothetical protein [Escherichia sp. 14.0993]MDQ9264816.1 hypothetical protein [Escherichia marmotae]MDQ9310809.1 hypothetical protein [Escherichia marmotae]MDZ3931812.1 hypothetical protein [Escherichia marmotae]MEC9869606.1 hypothetical protein [Escherichia marmotae]